MMVEALSEGRPLGHRSPPVFQAFAVTLFSWSTMGVTEAAGTALVSINIPPRPTPSLITYLRRGKGGRQ